MIKLKNLKKDDKSQEKRKLTWKKRSWIRLLLICMLVIVVGTLVWKIRSTTGPDIAEKGKNFLVGEEGKVTTVTESILEKTVKESKLYTAEYPYNGYTAVYDDDQKKVKYYVAYEGTVKTGIDVSEIGVSLEEDTSTIIIQLPEVEVENIQVEAGTMEYIFEAEKYNTETVAQEAYREACRDLSERAQADGNLIEVATESARTSARALVEPWINQMNEGTVYAVKVMAYGEGDEDE